MKVVVKDTNGKKSLPYPKLMKSTDSPLIVLFTKPDRGVVIEGDSDFSIGYFTTTWSSEFFKDFTGSITLSNE